jgi:hypothetical protein
MRRIFFLEAMHRRADLVFVAAALRLDGVGEHGSGNVDLRERAAAALSASVSLVLVSLQLRHRADVAGLDFRHVGRRLALQRDQVAKPFLRALRGVDHG